MRYSDELFSGKPTFDETGFSEVEREFAHAIAGNFSAMTGVPDTLFDGLQLYWYTVRGMEEAQNAGRSVADAHPEFDRQTLGTWTSMVARETALQLFSIFRLIDANDLLMRSLPSVAEKVDHELKKQSRRQLRELFPEIENIRTMFAHPSEISSTPKKRNEHSSKTALQDLGLGSGFDTFIGMGCHIEADQLSFSTTYKGKALKATLSRKNIDRLAEIITLYFSAFYATERKSRTEFRAWSQSISRLRPPG